MIAGGGGVADLRFYKWCNSDREFTSSLSGGEPRQTAVEAARLEVEFAQDLEEPGSSAESLWILRRSGPIPETGNCSADGRTEQVHQPFASPETTSSFRRRSRVQGLPAGCRAGPHGEDATSTIFKREEEEGEVAVSNVFQVLK